jgi:hypothetical protein
VEQKHPKQKYDLTITAIADLKNCGTVNKK